MADPSGSTETMLSSPGNRPANVRIESAWTETTTDWTVARVRAAIRSHEDGHFAASAALCDEVMKDAMIAGDVNTRCSALASKSAIPFKVEPGGGDGRKRPVALQRCRDLWWEACRETTLRSIQRDAILAGVAVGRVWWTRTVTEWRPRLVHLPLHGLEFSEADRKWFYTTGDGQRLEVTPGDGTWFLHLPYGVRSWMGGAIRQLGELYLMRAFARRDMARFSERNGMPVLAVYEPSTALDDVERAGGAESAETTAYYRGLRAKLGRDAVLRLPVPAERDRQGWDAKWLELTGQSFETFPKLLDTIAAEIHQALLGRDPGASAKGGDGELEAARVRVEYLAADAEPLSTSIRDCVWKPDVAYNIDPEDLELAAWGRWDTRPPPDLGARATTLRTLGEALEKLLPMGADAQPIGAEFGVDGKLKAPPKPEPAPPGAPKPGAEAPIKTLSVLLKGAPL